MSIAGDAKTTTNNWSRDTGYLREEVAGHRSRIDGLYGEVSNIKDAVKGLSADQRLMASEQQRSFQHLEGSLNRLNGRPQTDLNKVLDTVFKMSIMIGMAVSAIIWTTSGQFSPVFAKQELLNSQLTSDLAKIINRYDKLADILISRTIPNSIIKGDKSP